MSPAFERLEERVLLAATAELKGSTLVITFTGADTDVVLTGTAEGAITVAGTDADYDGASGPIEFDKNGNPQEATMGVYQYGPDNKYKNIDYVSGKDNG